MAAVVGVPITGYASLAAGLGGLLPDMDHPESVVGRRARLISLPLSAIFGHRGFTHSLLAAMLVGLSLWHLPLNSASFWLPVCVGYLSHLLGDALSASGVPLFYPLSSKRFRFPILPVNSFLETAVVATIFFLTLILSVAGEQILHHVWSHIRTAHHSFG